MLSLERTSEEVEEPSTRKTSWNHGRAQRASSSPACCRQRSSEYPPGYTVFECRLDGNQPIAQVVQVPPDTRDNTLQNKTCMILETKQSEFGPSSRVAAYPGQVSPRSACNRPQAPRPMSFALETRDRPGGAVACARKVAENLNSPVASAQPMTILETMKGPACQDGPSSRLTYGPVPDSAVAKSSRTYKQPAFYIQCATTPEGPVARVTQVPQEFSKSSGDAGTYYETFVKHDGSCPTAKVTQCNNRDESGVEQACEYLETRVCSSGPGARALTLPGGFSNVRHFTHLDVRPRENGPSARISQHPADPQMTILNLRDNRGTVKPATVCCCKPVPNPVARAKNPRKFATSCGTNRAVNGVTSVAERRNGLSPTASELDGRVGPFKYSRIKKGRIGHAQKTCPSHCCPPSALPIQVPPPCQVQPAPCTKKSSQSPAQKLKSPLLWPTSCLCPLQPCFKALERPRSEIHHLPGGTVVSRCPAPSLPNIAPVPLGPNRLRDYKPRPKTTGPRKTNSPTRRKPGVNGKTAKALEPKTTKKTKNKKTGSSGKHRKAPIISDKEEDKELPKVPSETNVEAPVLVSKGNQSDPIRQEPVYVQCPAYETKNNQSCICEEPTYIQCPAYEPQRKKSIPLCKAPSYVRCPAFESKKSSDTSSVYVPREDELINKYPEYFRAKTVETFVACRAKRNGLQDECHLHIPESVLRMSYEQRKNRHARTLVSSCRRRRGFVDECDEAPETTYCIRSEMPVR